MRVLLVSHAPNNPDAGASRVYHQLTEALKGSGDDVTTLHLNDLGVDWTVPYSTKQFARLPFMLSKRAAKEVLRSFDVIMGSNGMLYPLFRVMRSRGSRALLVNHLHGLNCFDLQANAAELTQRHPASANDREVEEYLPARWDMLGCRYADLTIVQNDRDHKFLLGYGISPMVKIPLAVHPRIKEAAQRVSAGCRRDGNQLLWFGHWIARKGAHYLPSAFELISGRCPKARLIVGGTGAPVESLMKQFKASLLPKIDFLPKISIDDQITLFSQSSTILFPSLSEGFGYALMEAMSMGVAAVTTRTGIGRDYLIDEHSALIVPFRSAVHLANAAIRLIENPDFRSRIARNGQVLSLQFDNDRFARDYQNAFSSVLSR